MLKSWWLFLFSIKSGANTKRKIQIQILMHVLWYSCNTCDFSILRQVNKKKLFNFYWYNRIWWFYCTKCETLRDEHCADKIHFQPHAINKQRLTFPCLDNCHLQRARENVCQQLSGVGLGVFVRRKWFRPQNQTSHSSKRFHMCVCLLLKAAAAVNNRERRSRTERKGKLEKSSSSANKNNTLHSLIHKAAAAV